MQDFRDLKVWGKAHEVTLLIYRVTEGFPATERFGLTSQMKRAAASVPANIAEGCVRSSDADFARYLHMALGSASEVEYFLLLARDLKFLSDQDYDQTMPILHEVKRMLIALLARLKSNG